MLNGNDSYRENYIRIIEAQPMINGRFKSARRIDQRAGTGTFSLVFRSIDIQTNQEAALKFYNPSFNGDGYRKKSFEREVTVLERLRGRKDVLQIVHGMDRFERIVVDQATGIKTVENMAFFATEMGNGNAWDFIYLTEPKVMETLDVFRQMARGVQRAHLLGICHRDIKPENFFRVGKRTFHLGDFGTARVLDGTAGIYEDYQGWRGDKRYTAPEQCVSVPEKPELFYLGDMYSLGAVLFEMMTKELLFPKIFDSSFHEDLSGTFALIPVKRREMMLKELVPEMAKTRKLPNISDFNRNIPACIGSRLERLYKGLASLDYARRIDSFGQLFRELDMCQQILAKQAEYERMIRLRREWFSNRKEKNRNNQRG